jgi:hypothetical protein
MNPLYLYDQISKTTVEPILIIGCNAEYLIILQNDYLLNGYSAYENNYVITSYNELTFPTRKHLYTYLISIAKKLGSVIKSLSIQNIRAFLYDEDHISYQIIDNNIYAELIIFDNNGIFKLIIDDRQKLYYEPAINRYNRRAIYNYIIMKIDSERINDALALRISSLVIK